MPAHRGRAAFKPAQTVAGGGGGVTVSGLDELGPMFGQNAKYEDANDITHEGGLVYDYDSEEWVADPSLLVATDFTSDEWTADPALQVAYDFDSDEWAADPKLRVGVQATVDFVQYPTSATWIDEANPNTFYGQAAVLNAKRTVPLQADAQKILLLYDLTGYPDQGDNALNRFTSSIYNYIQTTSTTDEEAPIKIWLGGGVQPFSNTSWNATSGGTNFGTGYINLTSGSPTLTAPGVISGGYAYDRTFLNAITLANNLVGQWIIFVIEGADTLGVNVINIQGNSGANPPVAEWLECQIGG